MNHPDHHDHSSPVRLFPRFILIAIFFGAAVIVVFVNLRASLGVMVNEGITEDDWNLMENEQILTSILSSQKDRSGRQSRIKKNNVDYSAISGQSFHNKKHEFNATSTQEEDSSGNPMKSSLNSSYLPPTCRFNYDETNQIINRIVFRHMRKAGGSSLRYYFWTVAARNNVDFEAYESRKMESPTGSEPKTLYVTHLRDPVNRALSHYKYQNRWKCNKIRGREDNLTEADVDMTLQEFIDTNWTERGVGLFNCASNCFSRWVTGVFDHSAMLKMGNDQLRQRAMKEFENNHLIIVSEWLKDPTYVDSLQNIFGVWQPPLNVKQKMFCGPSTIRANEVVPFHYTESQEQQIRDLNHVDIDIYRTLTSCQPQFHRQQQTKIRWEFNPNRSTSEEESRQKLERKKNKDQEKKKKKKTK